MLFCLICHTYVLVFVIYKIPCDNCGKVYIGQTSQHLEKRIHIQLNKVQEQAKKLTFLSNIYILIYRTVTHELFVRANSRTTEPISIKQPLFDRLFIWNEHKLQNIMNGSEDVDEIL